MRLFYIFPMSGPINGVQILSNALGNKIFNENKIQLNFIDTAQARQFNDFGKLNYLKIVDAFKIFWKLASIKKLDLVYLNLTPTGLAFYRDIMVIIICSFLSNNLTVHVHANGLERRFNYFINKILKRVKIIVINENQLNKISRFHSKLFLVPNALPDYFQERRLNYKKNSQLNLMFFSNISDQKGLERLEIIAGIIDGEGLNCKLNIFGGILESDDLPRLERLVNNYDFISYYGPVFDLNQKRECFLSNDIFLFLSDEFYEVSPLVYLEAIMSGMPIISTDQYVANLYVKLGVATVLKSDFSNFKASVLSFDFENEAFHKFREKVRACYHKNFSFDEYIQKIENVILNE